MRKSKLKTVQWVISISFIFIGLISTIGINIFFIFMAIFGALINPKFNDIYIKLTKKEPLKKSCRIIASVISFLMIYVAMGVFSASQDRVTTTDNKEVFTEITTVSTKKETTVATTTEKVTTTTEKVTETEDTTTTEEVTTTEVPEETTKKETVTTTTADLSSDIVVLTLQTMVDGYFDDTSVTYEEDSDMYVISITQYGLASEMIAVQNGTLERSDWDSMVDAMCESCKNIYDQIQEIDKGAHVSYFILNDINPNNVLVTIVDGVLFADAIDQ